jgi:hypothetical protein
MEIMGAIKGIGTAYRTGDFLYKTICSNKGIIFKIQNIWNSFCSYKDQKKLIELARANKLKGNSDYDQERIERLKDRNFIFLFLREKYTILQNDCLIITKEMEIKAIDNKDITLVNNFRPDYYKFPKNFNLKESKKNFRFTDFTINCKIYDENNKQIEFIEDYQIKNDNTFHYQITIKNAKKDEIFKVFYSISIPEEFKSKIIKTRYYTPIPYLEIIIQRDNYQGLLKLEDFRPSLKKYVSETEYIDDDSRIKNYKLEDFYYLKSIWQIWYNYWKQKEIPTLIMEYKEN